MAGEMLNRTAVGNREQVPEMTDTTRVPRGRTCSAHPRLGGRLWTAGKPWMTGISPVKGTRSCSRVAANNRFPSTGQPWPCAGHPRVCTSPKGDLWMPGWVYIMTNRRNGTLYVGVTDDLARRAWEHRAGLVEGFTKQYG